MTRTRTLLCLALVAALVAMPLAASASICPGCLVTTAVDEADKNEEKIIPLGWPTFSDARQCMWKGACPNLAGVAYADVDISDEMESYESYAQMRVKDETPSPTTLWAICGYDEEDVATACWWQERRGHPFFTDDIPGDTVELRLLPVQTTMAEYSVEIYVD